MAEDKGDMLREAAKARGFRLVKSRRRKPGGDFGLYGLLDLKTGRECLGFGNDGLTATAEQVHAFLRGGEVASWKRSLIGAVTSEGGSRKASTAKPPARPEPSRGTPPRKNGRDTGPNSGPKEEESQNLAPASRKRPSKSLRTSGKGSDSHEQEEARSRPPEPTVRDASRGDAVALAKLLGISAAALADRLAAAIRADEAPLVADQEGVLGVVAWTIIQTLQDGPHGRITLLLVAEHARRQGLGTRLLAEAERRLRDSGAGKIELALEIDFDAPTGFLRRTGYARTANGYGKAL